MSEKEITRHAFDFAPQVNGGETITLLTKVFQVGDHDDERNVVQELTLSSYCNSASFNLAGILLTPTVLRKLADELDEFKSKTNTEDILK